MKNNFKTGQTVTISKPGLFDGCTGEVLANNPDIRLSLTVSLSDNNGTWSFSYADIENNQHTGLKTATNPGIVKDIIETLVKVGFEVVKEKRKYQKRDKTDPPKIKRIYRKKDK